MNADKTGICSHKGTKTRRRWMRKRSPRLRGFVAPCENQEPDRKSLFALPEAHIPATMLPTKLERDTFGSREMISKSVSDIFLRE